MSFLQRTHRVKCTGLTSVLNETNKRNMRSEAFYFFQSKLLSSTIQVSAVGLESIPKKGGLFPQWCLISGNYECFTFPIVFKHRFGEKMEDLLDTGWPNLYLISDKLKSVLVENHITGWKTFEVSVLDKKGVEIEGYHGLSVTGRSGPIDYGKSEIIHKQHAQNAPISIYYKGVSFDIQKWDHSDIFLHGKSFGIIVTDKVAELMIKHNLKNIDLINISEYEEVCEKSGFLDKLKSAIACLPFLKKY